eukprot:Nitzschia sp. Nitz4//scaffold3_size479765//115325//117029//NITZ4_000049-RA/size479765-augustus-gene-0.28-mRNA-1//-1//CDS//3329550605//5492//frame0
MTFLSQYQRRKDRERERIISVRSPISKQWKPKLKEDRLLPSGLGPGSLQTGQTPSPIAVSNETVDLIHVEVEDLGLSTKSVSVAALASALAGSRRVLDEHGNGGKKRSTWAILTNKIRSIHTLPRFKAEENNISRRYALLNAFNWLEKSPGSSIKRISTWEDAKDALSGIITFPEETNETEDPVTTSVDETDINQTFLAKLDQCFRQEHEQNLVPMTKKWKTVASFFIPSALGGSDSTVDDEKPKSSVELADHMFSLRLNSATQDLASARISQEAEELEERRIAAGQEAEAKKRAQSLMRPLSEEEQERVRQAMYGGGPGDAVLAQSGSDFVQRSSIQTLRPGCWLNDEVIHYFLLMLTNRDEALCQKDPSRKRCHFYKSFFITKLLNDGHATKHGEYEYRNVKRWSKKAPGGDLFNLDKVFFPINAGQAHWLCACAFMTEKRIEVFDSMGGSLEVYLDAIFQYLQDDHLDKKKTPLPDIDQWTIVPCQESTPRQRNGFDCGVFTCMFIDFLSKDCPLVFSQEHITQCRERIALSILNGEAIM